jgi:hypothetical protein
VKFVHVHVKLRTSKEKQMGPFDQVHKIRGGEKNIKML